MTGISMNEEMIAMVRFLITLVAILVGSILLKKAAGRFAAGRPVLRNKSLPAFHSLMNWITLYAVVLLFLFSFVDSKWLDYTIYSDGDLDVTPFLVTFVFMIVSLAHKVIKLFTKYILSEVYENYGVDKGLGYTLNQVIYYTVMIIAFIVGFNYLGINLTALGALFGVLGIGIGFGMRNVAGNFVSGIIILFERPIEVGEVIQIDDKIGRVEKIRLRSTVIRTAKEGTLIVPNQYFIEQIIKNRTSAKMMAQVHVSVAYGTDSEMVQGLLEDAVTRIKEKEEGVLGHPAPDIRFVDFKNKSMVFLIEIPVANFEIKEKIESRIRHLISRAFVDHDIKLPGFDVEWMERNR
ncbi:mechanosensitive ion channel domain-containing protein [Bacillus sp. REN3]|uniref:mechanosensitive ion channel family protein n=1 Tax=Bacillus sp. REN3 TaxID=2802440 RepID=UPI001FEDE9F0|nr:mechanosensitive ion channel domain-containing protein [Bacillus sp. REN3]